MKKLSKKIALVALITIVFCFIWRLLLPDEYTVYVPCFNEDVEKFVYEEGEAKDVVEIVSHKKIDEYEAVTLKPLKKGRTVINLINDEAGYSNIMIVEVKNFSTIVDWNTGGFTGDIILVFAIAFILIAASILMLIEFCKTKGFELYSYNTIYIGGFSLFLLIFGINMSVIFFIKAIAPWRSSMMQIMGSICGISQIFLLLSLPFILIFSISLFFSNIELLRHERKRFSNVLGMLLSFVLVGGAVIAETLQNIFFSGSIFQYRLWQTFINVYTTIYVYFECMLIGAIICGIRAAKYKPLYDKDYIVILGCAFRKDGTLTPLLKGRVDKAFDFWKRQKEKTGKTAILMPSGGQGKDECMPEAEAMRNYLVNECKVPDEFVVMEDKSANTYQNMSFSKKLIETKKKEAKVVFSTTNYHVFRSGVWARLAGLKAEGMGSSTKWWFWPNAFIREWIGLLRNKIVQELILLVIAVVVFAFLNMIQG